MTEIHLETVTVYRTLHGFYVDVHPDETYHGPAGLEFMLVRWPDAQATPEPYNRWRGERWKAIDVPTSDGQVQRDYVLLETILLTADEIAVFEGLLPHD